MWYNRKDARNEKGPNSGDGRKWQWVKESRVK
jgi:hypothetical protein